MGFFQSEVVHALGHDQAMVDVIRKDGQALKLPHDVFHFFFKPTDLPEDYLSGWDFVVKDGETVNVTTAEVNSLEAATGPADVNAVLGEAIENKRESEYEATLPGEPSSTSAGSDSQQSSDSSTVSGPTQEVQASSVSQEASQDSVNSGEAGNSTVEPSTVSDAGNAPAAPAADSSSITATSDVTTSPADIAQQPDVGNGENVDAVTEQSVGVSTGAPEAGNGQDDSSSAQPTTSGEEVGSNDSTVTESSNATEA